MSFPSAAPIAAFASLSLAGLELERAPQSMLRRALERAVACSRALGDPAGVSLQKLEGAEQPRAGRYGVRGEGYRG